MRTRSKTRQVGDRVEATLKVCLIEKWKVMSKKRDRRPKDILGAKKVALRWAIKPRKFKEVLHLDSIFRDKYITDESDSI